MSLSNGAELDASLVDVFQQAVNEAVAQGASPDQATDAEPAFLQTLIEQVAQGATPEAALENAKAVFQAVAQATAATAAATAAATGEVDGPAQGGGLMRALASGENVDDVVGQLVQQQGGGLSADQVAAATNAFVEGLQQGLAEGAQPGDALAQAAVASQGAAEAEVVGELSGADALLAALASGDNADQVLTDLGVPADGDAGAAFADSLANALQSGQALDAALTDAADAQTLLAQAVADSQDPNIADPVLAALASGDNLEGVVGDSAAFQEALAQALQGGAAPGDALQQAGDTLATLDAAQAQTNDPAAADPLLAALASGDNVEGAVGDSEAFAENLANALEGGGSFTDAVQAANDQTASVDQALAQQTVPGGGDPVLAALASGGNVGQTLDELSSNDAGAASLVAALASGSSGTEAVQIVGDQSIAISDAISDTTTASDPALAGLVGDTSGDTGGTTGGTGGTGVGTDDGGGTAASPPPPPPPPPPPRILPITLEATEDQTYTFEAKDFQDGYEQNSGPALTHVQVSSLPGNGALKLSGANVSAGEAAVVVDGALTVTEANAANFDGGQFTAQVTTNNTAADRLTITNQGTGAGQIGFDGTTVTFAGTAIGTVNGANNGTGTAPLTIDLNTNATPAAVQTLARNVTYRNTDTSGTAVSDPVVSFTLSDGDGATSAAATRTVDVNVRPVLTVTAGSVAVSAGGSAVTVDSGMTVSDADSADLSGGQFTAQVTTNNTANDRLTITNQGSGAGQIGFDGTTVTFGGTTIGTVNGSNNGTGTNALRIDLNASATPAAVQALSRAVTYQNVNSAANVGNDPVVTFSLTDGDGATAAAKTRTIDLVGAPELTATSGLTGFLPGDGAISVDPSITVNDPQNSFNGGYLRATISANGETTDRLTIENQGTGAGQIGFDGTNVTYGGTTIGTASGGSGTTALTITLNANANSAGVQKLAQAIQYNSVASTPGTGNRTITFDVSDGSESAPSVTRTVTIDQVLDTFSSTTPTQNVLNFDGGDHLSLGNSSAYIHGNAATWEAWINTSTTTGTQTIFGAGDLGSEQIFSSTFASTPSGISISGSATVTGGALRLTNSSSQVGTATINPSGSAEQTKYFTSTFDVKIGDNTTGTDGDGWSFNYGGTSFTGGNPEEGASAGLAITFDTFDNGSGDVFNQVQVLVDGAVRGTASAPGGTLLTETPRVLTLDGDNDYVDAGGGTGGELRLTGTMTAEAWVQPDTFDEPTKVVSIGGKSGDGDGAENFLFQITLTTGGDVELFHEYGTGTNQQVTFDTNLTAGQWVHLAAVRDATAKTYTLYVNGQQSGSPQSYTTNAAGGANASLLIGGEIESNDAIGNTLNGQVDDVRIWNTARTASEVAENYQKTLTGDFSGNLVSHFTFDGGNANDSAGSNNGTLTNGAATTTSHTAPARFEPVSITVDANGLDMSYKGTTLFTNLDLGSAYNPQSGHQFVMSSRTGGADDVVAIDNLTITSTDAGSVNALVVDDGELAFKTTDSTGTSTVSSDVSVADGNWHHVAMSHDGNNTLKLYVDGVHVKTQTGVTKEMIGGDAAIGQASDSNADHFTGQIGEVRVWDAVMTDAQIDNNFGPNLSNPSSTSNLVGYWNMKDVSGQTVTDLSSNSNTATLGASGSGGGDDPTTQSTTYPQLNSSHWTIVEGAGSYNGDTILVQDGNVEISNRELLRSSTEYDPTSSNPLYVTGRFTFEKAADIFSVITRSSGVADSSFFGYPTTGVRFEARNETNNDLLAIYVNSAAGGGANDTALTLAGDSSINLKLGTEYEFEVFDDGTNLKFNMTEVGDPGNAASVTATSTFNPSTNYVVLTNREQLNTGNDFRVTVDDLRIDHSFVTGEGTAVSGTLNAPSVTGGTFSVVSGGGASNGTFTITDSSTGAFTYTPNAGFFGEETVRYQVTGSLDVQTVRINVNADLGVGIQSQALSFDGSNDYIDAGRGASDSLAIAGDLTVETWVKLDSLTGSTQGLIGFSGATNSETQANNILYLLAVGSDGTLSLSHEYDSGANVVMSSTETISVGEWVHVAGVRDTTANTWTLYLNGNAIANSNYGSGKEANGSSSGALKLGAIPITTGHDSFLDGQLDEVRIWNTTRSADDIRLSYDQQMTGSKSGLVTYYRFDRVTDGTVDDLTSNNNTGTLGDTAEPTVIDGSGKVASFDGSGDYITVPNASALNFGASGSFTLEGWVNTTQSINYARVMIKPGGSSQQSYSLAIHNGKAHVRFDQSGGGAFFAESVDTVNDGQWHHVAGVFDNANDTLKVYIDGKLAGTTTGVTAQPLQDTDALQIGGLTGISQWFDGQMDDLRIWNTARTDAQIAENYQQTLTGNQSGALVAHYTFDSSNANDSAGSNNGTASGNTAFVNGVPDGKTVPVYGNAVSINEGSTIAGHMTYDEVLSGSVSYHVMNGSTEQTSFTTTNGGTVTVDSTTGYWTYVPASAQSGTDTFMLRAKGATSGTDDEVVTVTVNKDVDKSVNVSDGIMQFDGSNDKVVSDGTITLTSHSMELWVNTTTTVADEGYLVTDQSGGAVAQILTNGNGTWRVEISNDLTNFKTYSSSVTVNDGQWHHLAYTFDATGNGTLKLYVDGVEDTSVTKTLDANLPSFSLTDELQMGVERGGNNFVDARIDEVRVWSDVRTSQEIQANYQNQITGTVPTQLKAYYRFDDEQTDGKVRNLGSDGNTLDATITEAQVINGFNKALNLDGSGDYVTVPAAPASSADMTLEAWFKWDGGNAWQRIFDFGEGRAVAPNDYMFLTPSDNNTNGKLTFGISTTAGSAQTMVGPALTAGQWYHAAVVIDSTADTGKLYLNGEAVATNTSLTLDPSQITTTVNYLGRSLHTADPDFDGQIGEFRIWNTARTDAQIGDNYNNPLTGSESGLVPYYTFDELVSGALVDEAGANNATVTGATIVDIAPTVYGTEVTIQENEAVTGTMATNDVAGTPTYSVQTAATKGTVIVDSTSGEWTYVPDVNYRGTDTFTLRATGATRGTDDETITVTVNAVNNDSINVHDGMVQFDGSNDLMRATVGTNTFSNQITMELWVNFLDLTAQQNPIRLGDAETTANRIVLEKRATTNNFSVFMGNNTTNTTVASDFVVSADTWYHTAFTYDGTTAKIYVNGNLVKSQAVSGVSLANTVQEVTVGGDTFGFFSKALVDDVRVWNTVRTAEQIRDNYDQQLTGSETNLQGYWRFDDDTAGTTLDDKTSNNRDGHLIEARYVMDMADPGGDGVATGMGVASVNNFPTEQITVEMWVIPDALNAALFSYAVSGSDNHLIFEVTFRSGATRPR